MKKLILVSPLGEEHRAAIAQAYPQLHIVDCSRARERVIDEIADAHVVYGMVKPEELRAARLLEFVQAGWHGVENLCYPEMVERGLLLANCRGMCSHTMAEHVLAMVLAVYRGIPRAVELQAAREWKHEPASPALLHGRTVGCLGTGSIGQAIAALFAALGCPVTGYNRRGGVAEGIGTVYSGDGLREFLATADVVVSSLPMTAATRGFMDAEAFAAMKRDALFVNVGRGGTVDEDALVAALEAGTIGGACLDVAAREPLPFESPLWNAPNCLITPHRSGASDRNGDAGYRMLRENLGRYLEGRDLVSRVDPAEGY